VSVAGVYGVYQCFSDDGLSVEESSLVRVLPYGEISFLMLVSVAVTYDTKWLSTKDA
jgi:hypothetical protein